MKVFEIGEKATLKKDLTGCYDIQPEMLKFAGQTATISSWYYDQHIKMNVYELEEDTGFENDGCKWGWYDDYFEQ